MNGYADLLAIDKSQERDARRDAKLSKIFMEEMRINNSSYDITEILKMYTKKIILPLINDLNDSIKLLEEDIDEIYNDIDEKIFPRLDNLETRVNAFDKFYPKK